MNSSNDAPPPKRLSLAARVTIVVVFIAGISVFLLTRISAVWDAHQPKENVLPELDPSFSDDERKLYLLSDFNGQHAPTVIDDVVRDKDQRFIPPMIDVFRLAESGALRRSGISNYIHALDDLSGVRLRGVPGDHLTSSEWIKWLGKQQDIQPPEGYVRWKGRLFGKIDPEFETILYENVKSTIRIEEILFGGATFDAIKAIDQPQMIPAGEAKALSPGEPVFGIEINGDARAYPQRYLDWHEMANDVIGGMPVSLAYCTLCGAAIAYDGRGSDGETYTFSSSGLLYRSNKLMYDHQTRTLWNHLTGRPVVGKLVGSDLKLRQWPVVTTTWSAWQTRHPETTVLVLEKTPRYSYKLGEPYGTYFRSETTMFPVWRQSDILPLKSRVFALTIGESHKAYPLDSITERKVINDDFASKPVLLIANQGSIDVDARVHVSRGQVYDDVQYNAGGAVRAYDRGEHSFQPGSDLQTVKDADGGVWRITESALIGPDGQKLNRLPGHLAYWLGWYSAHPETEVFGK